MYIFVILNVSYTNMYMYVHESIHLLAYIELGMENFKAISVHTESRLSRASFTDPCCFNIIACLCFSSFCHTNSAFLGSRLHIFPVWCFSLSWPVVSSSQSNDIVHCRSSDRTFQLWRILQKLGYINLTYI